MFNIPIKHPGDLMPGASTKDLYLGLSILFAYVFLDGDTCRSFKLRASAKKATEKLKNLVRTVVLAVAIGEELHLNKLFDASSSERFLADYGRHMIQRLLKGGGKKVDEVVAEILPTAAASVATQAQAMAQMLDVYLQPEHMRHWPEIRRCAYSHDLEDFNTLQKYALEGCRLAPAAYGTVRIAAEGGTLQDGATTIKYKKGDMIYTDFVRAGRDEQTFPNPDQVDITRDLGLYIHQGIGPHACIGRAITQVSLAVQLGLFAKLKNLKRMPGQAGQLKYSTHLPGGAPETIRVYMTEDWSSRWPFPTSKHLLHSFPSLSMPQNTDDIFCFFPAMKVQHNGFCKTIEEHEAAPAQSDMRMTDSGIGLPEIRMNGHF
jgi:Cytochrome P450